MQERAGRVGKGLLDFTSVCGVVPSGRQTAKLDSLSWDPVVTLKPPVSLRFSDTGHASPDFSGSTSPHLVL